MKQSKSHSQHADVLYRIKRGLAGYVSYLAACEMNESFSEYVLYEPILRILTGLGYAVQCEVPCPGMQQRQKGDWKRLDFVASRNGLAFAMEVKWAKTNKPDISQDILKLSACLQEKPNWCAFLCVFGTKSRIADIELRTKGLKKRGEVVIADFGKTRYGCRMYELTEPSV